MRPGRRRWDELVTAVLDGPGSLSTTERRAIAGRAGGATRELPEPLGAYVDKVALHAYEVTDSDMERLRGAGRSEDEILEATLAAAVGAARVRVEAGLAALAAAKEDDAARER
jgi:hypothetical protein